MWKRKILPVLAFLLVLGAVAAACDYSPAPGPVPITVERSGTCFVFDWSGHSATANDFNNYIIHATSNDSSLVLDDVNMPSSVTSYDVCTVSDGDRVTFFVQAYDGNAEGHYCSWDHNATKTAGTTGDAAKFFVYALFAALASIVSLIVILAVAIYAIKKMGIRMPMQK